MVALTALQRRIDDQLAPWASGRTPTREDCRRVAADLERFRSSRGAGSLWDAPPVMVTATLDDGWGHGLEIIEGLAAAVGVRISRLGLLQRPEAVLSACRRHGADLLGLTVLQFDSDEAVAGIVQGLPDGTILVAGGAAYRYDPDFARRTGTHAVARHGLDFLRFLRYYPGPPRRPLDRDL